MRRVDSHTLPAAGGGPSGPRAPDEALGETLARLAPRMRAVATRLVRDPDAAADVVQNAYEKVWRHHDGFRGDARLSTWIHRIVTNEALMWLRAESRRVRRRADVDPEASLESDPAPSALTQLLARERAATLRRGLARLGPEERDVLAQCGLGETSYRGYGRRRGLHPAAVKSRAYRARRRLAETIEGL